MFIVDSKTLYNIIHISISRFVSYTISWNMTSSSPPANLRVVERLEVWEQKITTNNETKLVVGSRYTPDFLFIQITLKQYIYIYVVFE